MGIPVDTNNIIPVRSLANSCPLEYGAAVYMARALLDTWEVDYDDQDELLCTATVSHKLSGNNEKLNKAHIFPNPASDIIHITQLQGAGYVHINNDLGQTVKKIRMEKDEISVDINTTHWASGIYQIHVVYDDDISEENHKVIIVD